MVRYFKLALLISTMFLAAVPTLGQNRESLEMIEKLQNLQFGSTNIPNAGLNFQLAEPDDSAPDKVKVKVYFSWHR